jgi:hypothetical protein
MIESEREILLLLCLLTKQRFQLLLCKYVGGHGFLMFPNQPDTVRIITISIPPVDIRLLSCPIDNAGLDVY